jgi:twitching motility protein PilI
MARAAKLNLRAFQQELATRLAAKTTAQVEQSRLGLACGGSQWLIRLAGVANIRGNLYSIIDFGAFLGHDTDPSAPGTTPARLVLFGPRVGELRAGLVVHRVLGLRNLAELDRGDATQDAPAWYGARWTDREGGTWQEIDLALLAQDPGFLQVGV